jgi:FAD synthase
MRLLCSGTYGKRGLTVQYRKHRARTDAYIKALEQEVVRLQKVEAESAKVSQRLFREKNYIKELEKQVVLLQREKISNFQCFQGQQAGYEMGMNTQEGTANTTMVSLLGQNGKCVLTARMPDESCNMNTTPNSTSIGGSMKSPDFEVQSGLHWQNLALINPLANHQTAIDFILQ